MAAPTVTNTFTNDTAADATEINQNFTDIINSLTDGTKDFTIGDLTLNGDASFNGNVTLGNATGDDITFTGRAASDLIPKTNAAYTLGNATLNFQSLYLDNDTTDGGAIYFDAGSSEYIRSSADGSTLEIGGFTAFDFPGGEASSSQAGLVTMDSGATTSIVGEYETTTFNAGGSFTGGDACTITRIGNVVTLQFDNTASHASATSVSSSAGIIPASYRPTSGVRYNAYYTAASGVFASVEVSTAGTITTRYDSARTNTNAVPSITWIVS